MIKNSKCLNRFTLYLRAVGIGEVSDAHKIALLLTIAGPQSIDVFNTIMFEQAEDKGKYDVAIEKTEVSVRTYGLKLNKDKYQAWGEGNHIPLRQAV